MNSACDRKITPADGSVSLLGPQNTRCKTPVSQRAYPHICKQCHATAKGGRCAKEVAAKSAYCADHASLDDPSAKHGPAAAAAPHAHAPVEAPETPPKTVT